MRRSVTILILTIIIKIDAYPQKKHIVVYGDAKFMDQMADSGRYYVKKYVLKDHLPDGSYYVYSKESLDSLGNKQLLSIVNYRKKVKNGYSFQYSELNKNIVTRYLYKRGALNGEVKTCFLSGKDTIVIIKGAFIDDQKTGRWEYFSYDKELILQKVENYKDGFLDGFVYIYDRLGKLVLIEEYKEDEMISQKRQ